MRIIIPKKTNLIFIGAPRGWRPTQHGECANLPVRVGQDGPHTLLESFWKPEPHELEALKAGACVVLGVVGNAHPVVKIGVEAIEEERLPKEVFGE